MNAIIATHGKNETRKMVADQIARRIGTEIVDSAKVGKAVEFYTEDFRVIRVY
jgi:hypothetical protein